MTVSLEINEVPFGPDEAQMLIRVTDMSWQRGRRYSITRSEVPAQTTLSSINIRLVYQNTLKPKTDTNDRSRVFNFGHPLRLSGKLGHHLMTPPETDA
ncbi:hypothetical protein GCM10007173_06520 [Glutamicibacter ardleyensis]|uniref:Uncharacterized protein n=1 Tax=Glutamicibacter ardleyensis TaxID=225894 RepID=A0ABQ2D9S3_9MICC|nr:hypothetical protein GCM10007173_06520 [Glutamicibacter ardleyensis]